MVIAHAERFPRLRRWSSCARYDRFREAILPLNGRQLPRVSNTLAPAGTDAYIRI